MGELFVSVVNMSISASWIVLVVIVLRRLLRKAPKWINPIFWGIVGLRLVIPFSIESVFSLVPSAQSVRTQNFHRPAQILNTGIEAVDQAVNPALGEVLVQSGAAGSLKAWTSVSAVIWVSGIILLLAYTVFSYLRLSRRVDTAVRLRGNIYGSEQVTSPFVLGFAQPKIYLPFGMPEKEMTYVIAHEQAHIERRDHLVKVIGFLILAVHWFNPVLWAAYIMLCRDIEAACDERVVRELNAGQRADYSEALLSCSVSRRGVSACPIAFGEQGVKDRVRNVLRYQKPTFWLTLLATGACAFLAVCFLTSPETASLDEITEEKGYVITGQEETDIILEIPKDVLPGSIYTDEGHEFEENEVVVYQTDTTTIYLKRVQLSNETEEQLYFVFDYSYDLPESGQILIPYRVKENGAVTFDFGVRNRDLTDSMRVFADAVATRGQGPSEQIWLYVSTAACKAVAGVMKIEIRCHELTYVKEK